MIDSIIGFATTLDGSVNISVHGASLERVVVDNVVNVPSSWLEDPYLVSLEWTDIMPTKEVWKGSSRHINIDISLASFFSTRSKLLFDVVLRSKRYKFEAIVDDYNLFTCADEVVLDVDWVVNGDVFVSDGGEAYTMDGCKIVEVVRTSSRWAHWDPT